MKVGNTRGSTPTAQQSVPGAGYVHRDKPGIIDYHVAHRPVDITNVAVLVVQG